MEDNPEIFFSSTSALLCWEMVRERLKQEIVRQRNQGKRGLPELQTPESMDGLEMFGFLSPAIIRVSMLPSSNLEFMSSIVLLLFKICHRFNTIKL